jgi:FixJ family two-component response regulator
MSDPASRFMVAVVDDDRRVLGSLAALLESADYVVRPFDSAAAMLESGSLAEIDCLISDVGMPVMDGFELLQRVRAARPELPVILISGRSDALARAAVGGGAGYRLFRKPFEGRELLAAVRGALQQHRIPDSPS